MATEVLYAISYGDMMNLHLRQIAGENGHHNLEAAFKAFGRALDEACSFDSRIQGVLSTKGAL